MGYSQLVFYLWDLLANVQIGNFRVGRPVNSTILSPHQLDKANLTGEKTPEHCTTWRTAV
jgi:hypothetical protein